MKVVSSNQKWKGFFDYGVDEYDYTRVEFYIEIVISDNSFEGISVDEESKDLFKESTKIKGFFDENIISFVMKYPHAYYINDVGDLEVDEEEKHPDIHYYGEFDKTSNSYKGKWEITYVLEDYGDEQITEVYSGNWELKRKEL